MGRWLFLACHSLFVSLLIHVEGALLMQNIAMDGLMSEHHSPFLVEIRSAQQYVIGHALLEAYGDSPLAHMAGA